MSANLILIIEDETSIAESLEFVLRKEGFEVRCCTTGAEGISAARELSPQLIVLDVNLPDHSGFEICQQIRRTHNNPVLFLTSRNEEIDRILGLEIGADDYVTKPFSPREVVARIKAIIRRGIIANEPPSNLSFKVDDERKSIKFHGSDLDLSRYEYLLLKFLLSNPGKVYTREALMNRLWEVPEMSLERTIDTHIKTIRQKLRQLDPKTEYIKTHRGFGYSFEQP